MATEHFDLPLLQTAQAQKEITHNEALIRLDFLVRGQVQSRSLTAPPEAVSFGAGWIVAAGANGAWAGMDDHLAFYDASGWRFVMPPEGGCFWVADDLSWVRFDGAEWQPAVLGGHALMIGGQQVVGPRLAAIDDVSGGTVVDVQGRAAVQSILDALRSHGLISP